MKKCPFCAEEIQDEAIKCRYCGETLNKKPPEKWYFKTWGLGILLFSLGPLAPLALPLLWVNPRFSKTTKIIVSIIVLVISYFLVLVTINALKRIIAYYHMLTGSLSGMSF